MASALIRGGTLTQMSLKDVAQKVQIIDALAGKILFLFKFMCSWRSNSETLLNERKTDLSMSNLSFLRIRFHVDYEGQK
jgi:hypothetical protein